MITPLKPLFSLEVWHDYYGRACPDVSFIVPGDTTRLLRGAGMLAKRFDDALRLLYLADEAGAPKLSAVGKTVRIGLVVRDAYFANITEGFNPASGALHYRNREVATALDPPENVVLRDVDRELWREPAFGLIDIAIAPVFYTSAPTFRIHFKARADTFRYYVVVKGFSNGDIDQLAVQDTSGSPGKPPGNSPESEVVKFAKVPPAQLTDDEKARTSILATDGAKVLLFRSLATVARRERSANQIQLMRNTEAVIERLPQPGKDRGTADLIVYLSKSKP